MTLNNSIRQHVGETFGSWTVLDEDVWRVPHGKHFRTHLWCKCTCGTRRLVSRDTLRASTSTNCGCQRSKTIRKVCTKHGGTYKGQEEPLYKVLHGMVDRCTNTKADSYRWYGAKGIRVCKEWLDYTTFREWALANGYKEGLVIDRINPSGNYEPANCRWITAIENSQRTAHKIKRDDGKIFENRREAADFYKLRVNQISVSISEGSAINGHNHFLI